MEDGVDVKREEEKSSLVSLNSSEQLGHDQKVDVKKPSNHGLSA